LGVVSGTSKGLVYPIDGLTLSPVTRVGTSNEVNGSVHLHIDKREMLLILPAEHLQIALDAYAPDLPKSPLAPPE
jgi:thiamine pyrophosphokinase